MVYFIPTPIGNLEDISQRSLKLLCEVTTVFCEDTRVTKKLFSLLKEKYNLELNIKNYISMHSHNEKKVLESCDIDIFNEDVAYVSDAGMPCISDPGSYFIQFCQEKDIPYVIIPGANAALLAYASSGFSNHRFIFYGFLPHKGKERANGLDEIKNSKYPVIIYESPHRIEKLMSELEELIPNRQVFFIKEATKKFEKKFKCFARDIKEYTKDMNLKGEWAIVVDGVSNQDGIPISSDDLLELNIPPKQKAKLLAKLTGESVKSWYSKLSHP
ncbi:16S rRNA (cytidine(1402)-2'-O)-methyltransferase [Sulfurospirillum sp. 1307]